MTTSASDTAVSMMLGLAGAAVIFFGVLWIGYLRDGFGSQNTAGGTAAPLSYDSNGHSEMVIVPKSEFLMGTSRTFSEYRDLSKAKFLRPMDVVYNLGNPAWALEEEKPARKVHLRSFAIDRYEVTNSQYRHFLDWIQRTGDHSRCHPDEPKDKDHTPRYWDEFNPLLSNPVYARTAPFNRDTFTASNKPVVGVDWYDAYAYAAWAGIRLPTEAEWERAARGTDGRQWPWGDQWAWDAANIGGERSGRDIPQHGLEKDGFIYPAKVGSFEKGISPAGCYDMAGNVAEWCADWFQPDYYKHAPSSNPPGPSNGQARAARGGSSRSAPSSVRCARRTFHEPDFNTFTLGFRCAKDL